MDHPFRVTDWIKWAVDDTQVVVASVVESVARLRDNPPPDRWSDVLDVTIFSREPHTLRRPLHSLNRSIVFQAFVSTLEEQEASDTQEATRTAHQP